MGSLSNSNTADMSLKVLLFTTLFLGLVSLSVTMSIDSDAHLVNEMESEDFEEFEDFDRESHPNLVEMRYFRNDADYAGEDEEAEDVLADDVNDEGVGSEGLVVEP